MVTLYTSKHLKLDIPDRWTYNVVSGWASLCLFCYQEGILGFTSIHWNFRPDDTSFFIKTHTGQVYLAYICCYDQTSIINSLWTYLSNHYDTPICLSRLKRYFRVFPAPGVEGTNHSPFGTVAVVSLARTLCLVGPAACRATLRLVGKAFRLEELLFPSAESEGSPTIGTSDWLVLKTHWMTSSLQNYI